MPDTTFAKIAAECDRLFNAGNSAGVGNYLRTQLLEAEHRSDRQLQLFLQSELMGYYRMQGNTAESLHAVECGLTLLDSMPDISPVSAGTICINAGTALSAAGFFDRALAIYRRAEKYYTGTLDKNDYLWAGLLNNMASVHLAQEDFTSAEMCYLRALDILKHNLKLADSAVSCINLAQLYARQNPEDPLIPVMLDAAMDCFDSPALKRDGYYAHSCSKCIPAFELFGYQNFADELRNRIKEIYERN